MIDNTKIHRHPINVAIIPANRDAKPCTFCLSSPWKKELINAIVAGSKHAADKPCKTRPNNNKIGACEIINAIEPSILNIRPAFVILTRPILSDNPLLRL